MCQGYNGDSGLDDSFVGGTIRGPWVLEAEGWSGVPIWREM